MKFVVNGRQHTSVAGPLTTLLYVLREELGLVGAKAGCQHGSCGSCTVLIDGEPRRSCVTVVATLDGAEVTTVEALGILPPLRRPSGLQRALCRGVRVLHARHAARRDSADQPEGTPGRRRGGGRGARRPLLPLYRLRENPRRCGRRERGERLGTMAPTALEIRGVEPRRSVPASLATTGWPTSRQLRASSTTSASRACSGPSAPLSCSLRPHPAP